MDQVQLLYFTDDHTGPDKLSDLHKGTVSLRHSQDPKQCLLVLRLLLGVWGGEMLFMWGQPPLLDLGKSWSEWEDRTGF